MSGVKPLQILVRPRGPLPRQEFAERLAPLFAGSERISARVTPAGLVIDCIWHADLEAAERTIRGVEPGDLWWSEPRIEYREEGASRNGRPVTLILEPHLTVEVRTPEDLSGTVIGDLSSRRGMIQGMDDVAGEKMIRAEVPLSELTGYSKSLEAFSSGRATATAVFSQWLEAPKTIGPDDDEPMSAALRA